MIWTVFKRRTLSTTEGPVTELLYGCEDSYGNVDRRLARLPWAMSEQQALEWIARQREGVRHDPR